MITHSSSLDDSSFVINNSKSSILTSKTSKRLNTFLSNQFLNKSFMKTLLFIKLITVSVCLSLLCLLTNNVCAQSTPVVVSSDRQQTSNAIKPSHDNPTDTSYHGIRFEETSSWKQLLQKAKEENKYIFVDCY